MRLIGTVARWSPVLLLVIASLVMASLVMAQETADPPAKDDQQAQPEQAEPQAAPPPEPAKEKAPFALYVEAGTGSYEPEDIDPSIETLSTHVTTNTMSWEPQDFARVAFGWKLQRGRGDFRLIFNGYSETGYELDSVGKLAAITDAYPGTPPDVLGPLEWWHVTAKNGDVHSERWPPNWNRDTDDANGNGFIDPGEQTYSSPDLVLDSKTFENMQNRAQTYDLVFGNVWGPRRVQGRWFGGLRYFQYDGNIPAGAWLYTPPDGDGFTDGSLLRLLNFSQKSQGMGPTGLMEVRFNFFNQVFQLYLNGQATFLVMSIDMDTGLFMTLVETTGNVGAKIPIEARLQESQTKSTWQTGAETGMRLRLKNGLKLEVSYGIVGFLDAIMLPTQIRVPENQQESAQGTSAIYNTQDYVLSGWRAGIAFQF